MRCPDKNPIFAVMQVENPQTHETEVVECCEVHFNKVDPATGRKYWQSNAKEIKIVA
jgi:hypothetical protein